MHHLGRLDGASRLEQLGGMEAIAPSVSKSTSQPESRVIKRSPTLSFSLETFFRFHLGRRLLTISRGDSESAKIPVSSTLVTSSPPSGFLHVGGPSGMLGEAWW